MRIILIDIFILLMTACTIRAQDHFFSQYYTQPIGLNPALTGAISGTFRAGGAYRQQWGPVLDRPFRTFTAFMDTKLQYGQKFTSRDFFAAGLVLSQDKLGLGEFSSTGLMITTAYHKSLSKEQEQVVSVGINIGLQQRSLKYSTLTFQDQYDLVGGYSLQTAESLPDNIAAFFNVGLGINYSAAFSVDSRLFMGLSADHLNQPNISFYQNEDNSSIPLEISANLPISLKAHIGVSVPIGAKLYLIPRILATKQGQYISGNVGTTVQFELRDFSASSFYIGGSVRPVKNVNDTGLDAAIFMIGFDRNNYTLGFSYDAQLNDLTNERRGQNTFEITFSVTADYEDEALFCPKF